MASTGTCCRLCRRGGGRRQPAGILGVHCDQPCVRRRRASRRSSRPTVSRAAPAPVMPMTPAPVTGSPPASEAPWPPPCPLPPLLPPGSGRGVGVTGLLAEGVGAGSVGRGSVGSGSGGVGPGGVGGSGGAGGGAGGGAVGGGSVGGGSSVDATTGEPPLVAYARVSAAQPDVAVATYSPPVRSRVTPIVVRSHGVRLDTRTNPSHRLSCKAPCPEGRGTQRRHVRPRQLKSRFCPSTGNIG